MLVSKSTLRERVYLPWGGRADTFYLRVIMRPRLRSDSLPADRQQRPLGRHGLSYAEIIVTVGIIAICVALLLPALTHLREAQHTTGCLGNLQRIADAISAYSADNEGIVPDPTNTATAWEVLIHPYLSGSDAFHCSADNELFPAIGSSYDWRDTGDPLATAAGKRLASLRPGGVLAFDALPGWHTPMKMNAVSTDGHAGQWDRDACLQDIASPAAP